MPKKRRFRSRIHPSAGESYGGDTHSRPRPPRKKRSFGGSSGGGGRGRRPAGGPEAGMGPQPDEVPLAEGEEQTLAEFTGLLEMHPNGYGFLRSPSNNYARERSDPFVPGR